MDDDSGIGSGANFNHLVSDGLAFTIAIEPENEVFGFFSQFFEVSDNVVHIIARAFDDLHVSSEDPFVVELGPRLAVFRQLILKKMASD